MGYRLWYMVYRMLLNCYMVTLADTQASGIVSTGCGTWCIECCYMVTLTDTQAAGIGPCVYYNNPCVGVTLQLTWQMWECYKFMCMAYAWERMMNMHVDSPE